MLILLLLFQTLHFNLPSVWQVIGRPKGNEKIDYYCQEFIFCPKPTYRTNLLTSSVKFVPIPPNHISGSVVEYSPSEQDAMGSIPDHVIPYQIIYKMVPNAVWDGFHFKWAVKSDSYKLE